MNSSHPQRLGDLLLEANLIDEIQLSVALEEQTNTGERLGSALVHLGFIEETVLAAFLSKQADLPCVNVNGLHISSDLLKLIPKKLAVSSSVIPIRKNKDTLYLAMADPFDYVALKEAAKITKLKIKPLIAPEFSLKKTLERLYNEKIIKTEQQEKVSKELSSLASEIEDDAIEILANRISSLSRQIESLTKAVEQLTEKINSKL
jgi:type IV pilus assembly protein PilB